MTAWEKDLDDSYRAYTRKVYKMYHGTDEELAELRRRVEKLEGREVTYRFPLDGTHGVSRCATP